MAKKRKRGENKDHGVQSYEDKRISYHLGYGNYQNITEKGGLWVGEDES